MISIGAGGTNRPCPILALAIGSFASRCAGAPLSLGVPSDPAGIVPTVIRCFRAGRQATGALIQRLRCR
jgi:hypothetical protein